MLSFRDTELRSSAGSLTHLSHSGRRTPRRRLATYPAVNSPMIAVSTTNACFEERRELQARSPSSARALTLRGIFQNYLPGLPATGKDFTVRCGVVDELDAAGNITRIVDYWNPAEFAGE
jgi:hypothetical protein